MTDFPGPLPHGPIEEVADDVFWLSGAVQLGPGMRINRNMTIVRSEDELTLFSSVRLLPEHEPMLERLGRVKHVVKIGHGHGMDDHYYLAKYGADYWALPNGARDCDPKATQELTRNSVPFQDAKLFEFRSSKEREAAVLVKRGAGTLITCDAVQNWPDTKGCSLLARAFVQAAGFARRPAQLAPLWVKFMTPEGGSLRADFERLAELSFDNLVAGHGRPLMGGARTALQASIRAKYD